MGYLFISSQYDLSIRHQMLAIFQYFCDIIMTN